MPTGISDTVTLGGCKTSILGDRVKKCQQRPYVTIDYFRQGKMLKNARNGAIVMLYRGHDTKIPLPNLGLSLYATNSFIILPPRAAPARSASARIARAPPTHYYGADTAPQGLAYTRYVDFGQAGPSRGFQTIHAGWE
jgi:hypothetical protein